MVKRRIPVLGTKENELIHTLNENLNKNKISPSQEFIKNNTETENDSEVNDYAQEVCDTCGTVIAKEEPVNFNNVETATQRWLKYQGRINGNNGYADAGPSSSPSPVLDEELSPETIEKITKIIAPVAKSIAERWNKDALKDNEDCRKSVNKEIGVVNAEGHWNRDCLSSIQTDECIDVMNKARKIASSITGKDLNKPKKTINDVLPVENADTNTTYEMVDHPTHYNQYDIEVIDMIVRIWGPEIAALWCDITAFKYRMRMGTKPDNSIEQDIKKEQRYLKKSKEIRENLNK